MIKSRCCSGLECVGVNCKTCCKNTSLHTGKSADWGHRVQYADVSGSYFSGLLRFQSIVFTRHSLKKPKFLKCLEIIVELFTRIFGECVIWNIFLFSLKCDLWEAVFCCVCMVQILDENIFDVGDLVPFISFVRTRCCVIALKEATVL